MHHSNGTIRGDECPLISLTTRGLFHLAVTRLEAAWDTLTTREQSLLLDILNLVATRHCVEEVPVRRPG